MADERDCVSWIGIVGQGGADGPVMVVTTADVLDTAWACWKAGGRIAGKVFASFVNVIFSMYRWNSTNR